MNDKETHYEQNLPHLLRASIGPDVRPAPGLREELSRRLVAQIRSRSRPAEFPATVLAAFSGAALLAGGAWLAAHLGFIVAIDLTALAPLTALLALNYLCLPVACVIIILRRKYA